MNNEIEFTFDTDFNLAAQKKFLTLIVFDKNWAMLTGLDVIKPENFENKTLNRICYWIHEYHKQFKAIPTQTVILEKAKDYFNSIGGNPRDFYVVKEAVDEIFTLQDSSELEYFKQKAVEFARQAAWKKALLRAGDTIKAGNYDDALNAFKRVMQIGSDDDLGLDITTLTTDDFLAKLGDAYDKRNMIQTGIPGWDYALGGGFVKNNIHIIGAPPGAGKSRTMAFLAKEAMSRMKKVAFFTLELSEEETMANIYTAMTGVTLHDMLQPEGRAEFEAKKNTFVNTYLPQLCVKFFKPGCVTVDSLHNYLMRFVQRKEDETGMPWKPDVIFVDYLDKLLPTNKGGRNSYEDMGGVANDLKNLAITFGCPVVTGSQLGKISWDLKGSEVVSMQSVAESAAKVHLAHSMTTINANPGEKQAARCRLYTAKSRSGKPGQVIFCEQNLGKCLMYEVEKWEPSQLDGTVNYSVKVNN